MNGPLEEQMEGMTGCDKVCLGVVSTPNLLPQGMSQSSLVDEAPREGINGN